MSNNPWGGGDNNNRPHNNGSNNIPPDIEDIIKQLKDKINNGLPPGSGSKMFIAFLGIVLCVGWLLTGFYPVKEGEQGVVLQFGEYLKTTTSGLNYHLPYPIQQRIIVNMENNRNLDEGRKKATNQGRYSQNHPRTLQILTGDENIVNIDFDVRWKVSNASNYLFKVKDPEQTVNAVSESVMREVVGRNKIDTVLTEGRDIIESKAKEEIQKILDDYQAGMRILQVAINEALPPEAVSKDFKDVQAARADQERALEEAKAYENKILPGARGEAVQIKEKANAYKEQVIAEATGDISRFEKIYEQYSRAPEVTKKRIYLETMEKLLAKKNKLIISEGANKAGVLPYLRLDEFSKSK